MRAIKSFSIQVLIIIASILSLLPSRISAQCAGGILVSEVMYDPSGDIGTDANCEYIEIFNANSNTVDISGWTISGTVTDFIFPANTVISSGEYIILASNPANLPACGYGMPSGTQVFDFVGSLNNSGTDINISIDFDCPSDDDGDVSTDIVYDLSIADGDGNAYYTPLSGSGMVTAAYGGLPSPGQTGSGSSAVCAESMYCCLPELTIVPTEPTCSVGGTIVIASPLNGLYSWTGPNGFSLTTSSPTITDLFPGQYDIIFTDNLTGCTVEGSTVLTVPQDCPCGYLACNNKIQVSLGNDCNQCINPDMVLEGDHDYYGKFVVEILDSNEEVIEDVNCVGLEHVGVDLIVRVSCGINSCWGTLVVEDKLPPRFANCPEIQAALPASISCADLDENWQINVELPDSVIVECNEDFTVSCVTGLEGDMCSDDYVWAKRYVIDYPTAHDGRDTSHACIVRVPVTSIGLDDIICPDDQVLGCREDDFSPGGIYDYYINPKEGDTTAAYAITQAYPYLVTRNADGSIKDTVRLTSEHCNILSSHSDTELPICQFQRKIIRKWTFVDWCTSRVSTCDQVIKLVEDDAMICAAPADFDVPLGAHCVTDSFDLPLTVDGANMVINSGCGNVVDTTIYFKSKAANREAINDSPFIDTAIVNGDGTFTLPPTEAPFDSIWIKYEFTNACGEICEAFTEARVIDNQPPTAICNPDLGVSFSNLERGDDGLSKIYASSFDAGSHDNSCGEVYFKIIRMESLFGSIDGYWNLTGEHGTPDYSDAPRTNRQAFCDEADGDDFGDLLINGQLVNTGTQIWFDDHLKMCCTDDNFMVVTRVFDVDPGPGPVDPRRMHATPSVIEGTTDTIANDLYGHFNDCMVELEVQDKTQILGACQPFSLFCDEYPDNPNDNAPEINMVCSDEIGRLVPQDSVNISDCGNGLVIRDWYAVRGNGDEVKVCTQSIVIESRAFDPYSIMWPKAYVDGTEAGRRLYKDENDVCVDSTYQVPMGGALDCSDSVNSCEPTWSRTACSMIGLSSKDDTLLVDGDACMKIIRTWNVIDWCLYNENTSTGNPNNSDRFEAILDDCNENCDPDNVYFKYTDVNVDGFYTYQQVLKIVDDQAPTLADCTSHNIGITQSCNSKLTISKAAGDGTGCGQSYLKWLAILQDTSGNTLGSYPGVTDNPGTFEVETTSVPAGVYKVTWLVGDACGNESSCEEEYIVEDQKAPTPICIRDLSTVLMPSTGSIEIWASDYDLKSEDNCEEVFHSFSGDSIQANLTITCDDMEGFAARSFNYQIYAFDAAGNADFCYVTLRIDAKEVCGGEGEDGSSAIIQGYLATENGVMISDAEVMVTSNLPEYPVMSMTAEDGAFAFSENPLAYDYDISIEKDGDDVNGVSTLDIVLIQKHILGIELLDTPYKMIAADANSDQRVTAADLVQIRKLILGIDESYIDNTSWRFVDADQTFSSAFNPWPFVETINIGSLNHDMMEEDFVGVKIGDVNGNASANGKGIPEVRSVGDIVFEIKDKQVRAGESVSVAFTAENFEEVSGYQMTLAHQDLKLEKVEGAAIDLEAGNVATFDNYLTMSWNSDQPVTNEEVLFTLTFRAENDLTLSKAMAINSRVTIAEAYVSESLDRYDLQLQVSFDKVVLQSSKVFVLHQNKPNPFAGETTITFVLPEANQATLTLMDVTGRLIKKYTDSFNKGFNEITINADDIQTSGIIYYQLESGKRIATKKMILIE